MKYSERELFLAEGTAESGCVYNPSKRVTLNESSLLDYINQNTPDKKKIGFNIDPELPSDLEEKIRQCRPKAIFQRTVFKRKPPQTHLNID